MDGVAAEPFILFAIDEFIIGPGTNEYCRFICHKDSVFFRNGVYRLVFGEFQQVVPAQLRTGGFPAGIMA